MNNFLNSNYLNRLVEGHNYLVLFGTVMASFERISGISNELIIDTINERGVNDAMVMLTNIRKKPGTVIFEQGVYFINPLNIQFETASRTGKIFTLPTTILIFGNGRNLERAVGYNSGVPVSWSVSEPNAEKGKILMDRVEVIHQGLFNVPL